MWAGQPARDQIERVARRQDRLHVLDVIQRVRRRDLCRHFPPRLVVRPDRFKRGAHACGGEFLKRMHQGVRRLQIAVRERTAHAVAIGLRFRGREVA
jgi:hypothetical protein